MSVIACAPAVNDDPLERARRLIDRGSPEPLTLDQLAGEAGLSSYHFSRQFTARFGISPVACVRQQRLTLAADRLCRDRSTSLIDLAFDTGFDSQEAFTRAFKRLFGVPPGQYRRKRHPLITESIMTKSTIPLNLTQSSVPVRKGGLRIVGPAATFDEATKSGIPQLWQQLISRLPIAGQVSGESYGVCAGMPGQPGTMRYMAGIPVSADAPVPDGFEVIDIAPHSYLVFRQILDGGDIHQQMSAAAREIWGERLPKSGHKLSQSPDLEWYSADFRPDTAGVAVEWWIPVEE